MKSKMLASLALLTFTMAGFQNCSGFHTKIAGVSGKGLNSSGNGDGYTGKVFVEMGMCAGVVEVKAKIVEQSQGRFYMTRDNCEDIAAPELIPAGMITANPASPDGFFYGGDRTFLPEDMPIPAVWGLTGPQALKIEIQGQNLCLAGGLAARAVAPPVRGMIPAPDPETDIDPEVCSGERVVFTVFQRLRDMTGPVIVHIRIKNAPIGRNLYSIELNADDVGKP